MGSKTPLGALLRAARKGSYGRSYGFRELEDRAGVPKPTLEAWENGTVPSPPITRVMVLADYMEIPLEDLRDAR